MKKIYNTGIYDNDIAKSATSDYIKFAIIQIDEATEWLSTTKETAQDLLAQIDILLTISNKQPVNANLLIKKNKIQEWKIVFYAWYERVNRKITAEYRKGIKQNADELFTELEKYGY